MATTSPHVVLTGVPWDGSSSFLRGAARGPSAIRDALWSPSSNSWTEDGLDLAEARSQGRFVDGGDVDIGATADESVRLIRDGIDRVLSGGGGVLSLGGDHSITFPILDAHARHGLRPAVLHIDAHADLYDVFEENRLSHACPFARIMEAGLASRLVQVGIRTLTRHQREQAERFGVEIIEMRDWSPSVSLSFADPVVRLARPRRAGSGICARRVASRARRALDAGCHWPSAPPAGTRGRRRRRGAESRARSAWRDRDGRRTVCQRTCGEDADAGPENRVGTLRGRAFGVGPSGSGLRGSGLRVGSDPSGSGLRGSADVAFELVSFL